MSHLAWSEAVVCSLEKRLFEICGKLTVNKTKIPRKHPTFLLGSVGMSLSFRGPMLVAADRLADLAAVRRVALLHSPKPAPLHHVTQDLGDPNLGVVVRLLNYFPTRNGLCKVCNKFAAFGK